jgi:phospholipid transport system substrate-binding protein
MSLRSILFCALLSFFSVFNQTSNAPYLEITSAEGAPATLSKKSIKSVQKPIKRLLKAIRYQKDEVALKSFNGLAQGALLLDAEWSKHTLGERETFVRLLHSFFTLIAFPKLRGDLEHLETILYDEPHAEGELMTQKATIVVLHALKKQEVPVEFILKSEGKTWLISDFTIGAGSESFLVRLKRDQIQPLLKERGWAGLIEAMEGRITQLKAKAEMNPIPSK